MRALVLVCAACSAAAGKHGATPAPTVNRGMYDAYVLDAMGLVAHARVDVVKLRPLACPCAPLPRDEQSNQAPTCSCAASIPMWREALDHCVQPTPVASVTTDDHGHVLVPAIAGTTLVATGGHREAWAAAPTVQAPISLELSKQESLRVSIDARAAGLHAAVIYDTGRCVPLVRDGATWIPNGALDDNDSRVVVAANADGFGVDTVPNGNTTAEITIYPTRAASGECPTGTTAHLDGAFQHAIAQVDANGAYTFPHLLGFEAHITCVDANGTVTDEAIYDPTHNSIEGTVTSMVSPWDDVCIPIAVVDQSGHPVAGASVSSFRMSGNFGTGAGGAGSGITDAHGNGCSGEDANLLRVAAPIEQGGQCAGQEELTLTQTNAPQQAHTHIPVTLHIRELPRVAWRGRVVSPEGVPVANAVVRVDVIAPDDAPDCYDRAEALDIATALDGTFTLPELPRGKISLDIHHNWYVNTHFETRNTGPSRDIVVGRGATWTGRVLDPDGHAIDTCQIFVTKPDQSLELVECEHGNFALSVLPPGVSKLDVRLSHHALGETRNFVQQVTIVANEHRVADIRWPAGETIAGIVVDAKGAPVAGARVDALPKSVKKVFQDRFDDAEVVVVADATGRFTFRHLTPGAWVLKVGQRTFDVGTGTLDARIVK